MKSLLRKFSYFFFVLSLNFLFSISPVHAQGSTWTGKCVANGDVATIQGLECLFANILQVIVTLAGIAFFVMFINGGFQYIFSSGDQKRAAAASSSITVSIIGIVGVVSSYLILRLIQNITGVNVTEFKIPNP